MSDLDLSVATGLMRRLVSLMKGLCVTLMGL